MPEKSTSISSDLYFYRVAYTIESFYELNSFSEINIICVNLPVNATTPKNNFYS